MRRFLLALTCVVFLLSTAAQGAPGEDVLWELSEYGVAIDPAWYGQQVTPALALDWLMAAYERLVGPVSLDGVIAGENAPEAARKAAAVGLLLPEEQEEPLRQSSALSRKELVACLLRWASLAERGYCRRAAEPATVGEAKAALQLAADLAGVELEAGAGWPGTTHGMARLPLTRALYARGAVALLDHAGQISGELSDLWLPELDDCEDIEARAACGLGLMSYVALEPDGFICFDPDRVMSMEALREHALRFALATLEYRDGESDSLTVGQAAPLLCRLLREFAGRAVYSGPVELVDNGAGAPWYMPQEDSGDYSDTNCMPAATAMALRWLDPDSGETPESLRALYPMDGAPWYTEQVMEVFIEHGARFALRDIELDDMVKALDAGHILLALLNENGAGHCAIVKGYLREGPGLWFILYDPASPRAGAYGAPSGLDRRVEATELLFEMECHWWMYFDISREAKD